MSAAHELHKKMIAQKKSLAVAESFTGGLISTKLTAIPGCSAYFKGSIVAYSNEAKERILKVTSRERVCSECAQEMAEGVLSLFGSDYAIATTGIAGPAGAPVGALYFCVLTKEGKKDTWHLQIEGDRKKIMEAGAESALERLLKHV